MVHPLYNIGVESALTATQYFNNLPVPETRENNQTSTNTSSHDDRAQTWGGFILEEYHINWFKVLWTSAF